MNFTEYIAEYKALNEAWSLSDREWISLLINKSADFINHQLKLLHIYKNEELTNGVLDTINKEIATLNELLQRKYEEREEIINAN